jgi:hypothetical protein
MSDEALLIGGEPQTPPQGSTGISTPIDILKVKVFAVFKAEFKKDPTSTEEEYVVQEFTERGPSGVASETVAHFVWTQRILAQAAIKTVGSDGQNIFYPLDRFQRFPIEVSPVVGVQL